MPRLDPSSKAAFLSSLLLTATIGALGADRAQAQDANQLTGDWGGLRTQLAQKGYQFQAGYTEEAAGNTSGGTGQYFNGAGQLMLGATLDLEKILAIPGATVQFTVTNRNGSNLVDAAGLNTLQLVQEVYGRGNIWRLVDFWYEQKFFDDALSWKGGRMTLGEDFAGFSCDFQNLTFCGATPGNLVGNYWFNWPVSQWGTRVRFGKPDSYFQIGAYQVDPRNAENNGFYMGFSDTTGVLIPAEVGWKPTLWGMAGSYTATVWYDTSSADDVYYNSFGAPLGLFGGSPMLVQGRYGFSVHLQQQVYQPVADDPVRGLSVFLNITQTDTRTSQTDNQVAVGFQYTGPFNERPRDVVALAFGRTQLNGNYVATEALQNAVNPGSVVVQNTSEYVIETYYNIHVCAGLDVRPNFQYIFNPGGVSSAADVGVIGLKTVVNF
ncbi:carbohydrate porin [Aquabacter sp. CN5-332]|uniref:carbohydrate porin n=1 Tax=Aquabacter sp. CN5-332 TaxID=3156608 RepID=UPI0032B3EE59